MKYEILYLQCNCGLPSHVMTVHKYGSGEYEFSYRLNHYLPFLSRIKVAIFYILGIDKKDCHDYDCTLLDQDDINQLIKFLNNNENLRKLPESGGHS